MAGKKLTFSALGPTPLRRRSAPIEKIVLYRQLRPGSKWDIANFGLYGVFPLYGVGTLFSSTIFSSFSKKNKKIFVLKKITKKKANIVFSQRSKSALETFF